MHFSHVQRRLPAREKCTGSGRFLGCRSQAGRLSYRVEKLKLELHLFVPSLSKCALPNQLADARNEVPGGQWEFCDARYELAACQNGFGLCRNALPDTPNVSPDTRNGVSVCPKRFQTRQMDLQTAQRQPRHGKTNSRTGQTHFQRRQRHSRGRQTHSRSRQMNLPSGQRESRRREREARCLKTRRKCPGLDLGGRAGHGHHADALCGASETGARRGEKETRRRSTRQSHPHDKTVTRLGRVRKRGWSSPWDNLA